MLFALKSPNTPLRLLVLLVTMLAAHAVYAADDLVNRAVEVARGLYHSDNSYDQILGAGVLADIGDTNALGLLEQHARGSDIVYQRSAIDTLIGIQHPNGIDLIYRLAAEDASFTQFLIQSLATNPRDDMGDFLLGVLENSKPQVQQYAIQALVHMKEDNGKAAGLIQKLINDPDALITTKAYGYYYLAERGLGGDIESDILDIVATGDLNQREVAAVALRFLDSEASRNALESLKRSQDARVSLAAISSSAALGNDAAIAELLNIIARGKSLNAEVGASALRRLPPALAHKLSVELFALNLRPDPGGRLLESWRAIEWDASEIYAWGLANANADLQMQTIWLVGQRQDAAMLAELSQFLDHADAGIRGMAAWAIVHIAPEAYTPGTKV